MKRFPKYSKKRSVKNKYKKKMLSAKAVEKIAKKVLYKSSETKHMQGDLSTYWSAIGTSWSGTSITGRCIQGTGVNNRIGNKIKMCGFRIRGFLQAGDDLPCRVRIILAYTTNDFDPTSPGIGLYDDVRGLQIEGIKKIAFDKYYSFDADTIDNQGTPVTTYKYGDKKIELNFKPRGVVNYTGAGTDTEMDLKLCLMMLSDDGDSVYPGFTHGEWTLWFKDY